MDEKLVQVISAVKTAAFGAFVFVTPDDLLRHQMLERLAAATVCPKSTHSFDLSESCADCIQGSEGTHPRQQWVTPQTFNALFDSVLFSYPPKSVQIENVDQLSLPQQTRLLIWLEMYQQTHKIILSAGSIGLILPTIISRTYPFQYNPKKVIPPDELERAFSLLNTLLKGEFKRIEDTMSPEDGAKLADAMKFLLMEELEGRARNSRKAFSSSTPEIQTLYKILDRYLEAPKVHNLPLLFRSFQMLALQNVR